MSNLNFRNPRELIEYLKEMFLKSENVDEFASDFYEFAFQDIDGILKDKHSTNKEDHIKIFNSIKEAESMLSKEELFEGMNIIITPKKKKPVVYIFENGKFVKSKK